MTSLAKRVGGGALAVLALTVPASVTGQDLSRRVAQAPDGWVRFSYDARDGVCGSRNGVSFTGRRIGGGNWSCDEGPVRVELRKRGSTIQDIDTQVAGRWESRSGAVTDLGTVMPQEAADLLFEIVETEGEEVAKDAIFPATIARGVETWPRLLEFARGHAYTDVRRQAVFWLGQEASERATEGLTSIIEDEGELEVREHAIFALSQRDEPRAFETLMRLARTSPEPKLRRQAIFWLGQSNDPRVLSLLEEILTRGG